MAAEHTLDTMRNQSHLRNLRSQCNAQGAALVLSECGDHLKELLHNNRYTINSQYTSMILKFNEAQYASVYNCVLTTCDCNTASC
jgi:hypothetical protein